jgi:hypothetical protein
MVGMISLTCHYLLTHPIFIRAFDSAELLELMHRSRMDSTRFKYRAEIGELIWPMITMRPELSYPIVKLSQLATNPATIHYDAVDSIFQ